MSSQHARCTAEGCQTRHQQQPHTDFTRKRRRRWDVGEQPTSPGSDCPPVPLRLQARSLTAQHPRTSVLKLLHSHRQDLQRTRAARRLHVAKVPGGTTPQELSVFFNALMRATGRTAVPSTNDPIISCTVTPARHFAFLEFEHVADAESALSLSGIVFRGNVLILSRSNCITSDEPGHQPPQTLLARNVAHLIADQLQEGRRC